MNNEQEKLSILPILKQVPFFVSLNENDHHEIIKHIEYQLYPANYTIFKEGDLGEKMFFIRKGKILVTKKKTGFDDFETIAQLGPGDFFGEMALISNEPRNANVTTLEETEVFTLSKYDLFVLIQNNVDMAGRINKEFIDRFNENDLREKRQSL